jgi:hypothetical protein
VLLSLLFLALFFLISCLVLREAFKVERRNMDMIDVFELWQHSEFWLVRAVLERVIRVEGKLVIIILFFLFCLHSGGSFARRLTFLGHNFLEAVSLDELDPVFFVDFVHRNTLILQREKEVDELGDFVLVVDFILLDLLHFPLKLFDVD